MNDQIFIGRRKTSVARVIIRNGSGKITVNGRDFENYFTQPMNREDILSPFRVTQTESKYDLSINVTGGGTTGQSQAIRLAVSRALDTLDSDLRSKLKVEGFLRRDPRMVERKKYGRPKARKRFQFSKR
ncbi:MAG: 30S ribosomal protein S9 [Chlorobiaceae bacterium]|nr:30S ribosomal protein S9 [Chlorobiaceae bacterium]MBA4310612.1 30S ribosomal protein S9 [Chlorobiaceae bacterium]